MYSVQLMDEEKGVSKESEENAIEEILEKFKFELVYAYMKMVGWTYFNSPNTPTISQLKETAEGLLKDVEKKNGSRLISGGSKQLTTTWKDNLSFPCGSSLSKP